MACHDTSVWYALKTSMHINFMQLDTATSQDDINDIIDDPRYMAIVNSSGWPTTKCITTISKSEFLQQLVLNEVIMKRQHAIKALCRGLDRLNVAKLIQDNSELMQPVFLCDANRPLTAEALVRLISTPKPADERLKEVYGWFIQYLTESNCRKATLEEILSFMTGLTKIPPMGLKDTIKVQFLQSSPLPRAEACFCIIKLPTVHMEKTVFFDKLDQGIRNSIGYFGRV